MARTVKVLVGTRKAAFIYTSDEKREKWDVSKPIYTGWSMYNMAADTRGDRPRLYAAANHWAWGPSVAKSDDLGETWDYRSKGLAFAPDSRTDGAERLAHHPRPSVRTGRSCTRARNRPPCSAARTGAARGSPSRR